MFGLLLHGASAQDRVHVVVRGDTIYSLSRTYRVSQEELMRRNDITDASRLLVGMRLAIPSAGGDSPPAAARFEYTVSQNDTLYSIARRQGVTLQVLRDINGFSRDYVLKAGEKIKIPYPAPAVTATAAASPAQRASAQPPARATVDPSVRWPVAAKEILYMNGNMGVLVTGTASESVKSLSRGTVVYASTWRGYGNVAIVESDGGYRYLYGACETLSVRKGDVIEAGTELGKLGIYPASGKPDLVLLVSQNGSPVDPARVPRF
ncbi:MAG: M23 family metallopeptidase [Treponema sp.]|jgi:murein DD-endopeptidase MepM/ murein hydrolase activator NlpD|nr:M23 family metallopeptidase [Treponema sp.]